MILVNTCGQQSGSSTVKMCPQDRQCHCRARELRRVYTHRQKMESEQDGLILDTSLWFSFFSIWKFLLQSLLNFFLVGYIHELFIRGILNGVFFLTSFWEAQLYVTWKSRFCLVLFLLIFFICCDFTTSIYMKPMGFLIDSMRSLRDSTGSVKNTIIFK